MNEVRLYKHVPFSIDYKNIIDFDDVASQSAYFNSLPNREYTQLTYTRDNGVIKVKGNREELLDYNYMSFTNLNYSNKTFYAFITKVEYVSPEVSKVYFVIDEWQTWCFDITFRESFIERKHCKRWNSDGTPVVNTQDEGLDIGSEYIVKDHREYNNDLYWICFVTSLEATNSEVDRPDDVPTILATYYAPIYKTTSNTLTLWTLNGTDMDTPSGILTQFKESEKLVGKLVSCFIVSEAPFNYTYTISGNTIAISSNECSIENVRATETLTLKMCYLSNKGNPANVLRTFPKYGNLKNNITESKLLMYPYSFVQLVDGQGNSFDIKNEYLDDTQINIRTFTSSGLNAKQAHIVDHYRYTGVTLNYCRWELGNGIINSYPNNLTIIDDYSAAYLQGNANQMNQTIQNTLNQTNANNKMAQNTMASSVTASMLRTPSSIASGMSAGGVLGGLAGAIGGVTDVMATDITSRNNVANTELQGNVTDENAINSALAKKQDIKNVADNVALQGGDVYFTYQNQYSGYCLVYKQISDEYISILENYFKKYGYKYNKIETPVIRTRKSWDYIRCIDTNIVGNINEDSLLKIKTIFDNGVTVWHTTDVGNYSLNNDER